MYHTERYMSVKPCIDVASNLLVVNLQSNLQQKFQHAAYLTCNMVQRLFLIAIASE